MNHSLLNQLNSSPYDYYFLVVDEFLDINIPELSNFRSISANFLSIDLKEKNSGRLLSHPDVIKYINENSLKTGRKPAIIPFKPSAKIDFLCHKYNWTLISNPAPINRTFEDKLKFTKICDLNNITTIPHRIDFLSQKSFDTAQKKFGQNLVIQTHFGWAGNSSFLVNQWSDIENKIIKDTKVKYSPYLNGYSLINNCCLTSQGLIQSPPGLQYTGIKPLTQNPLATVGRQWPSYAPQNIQKDIYQITTMLSSVMEKFGYKGFFGLDFLVSNQQVYLLECNPRLTASFAFYTDLERNRQLTPLFFYHLAEFSNLNYRLEIESENLRFFNTNIIGSEITLKNESGATLKKFQEHTAFITSPNNPVLDQKIIAKIL